MEITAKTKLLAVIGDPIEHSMSPKMHNAALRELGLDYSYVAFHVLPAQLKAAVQGFRALDIRGVNVTIPHKVAIMEFLDEIDPVAQKIGAINTIKNDNGVLRAKNTDGEGSIKSLRDAGFDPSGKIAVVMGAGGAARALTFFLAQEVNKLTIFDINPDTAKNLANKLAESYEIPITAHGNNTQEIQAALAEADLFINATPIGMSPKVDQSPIDASWIRPETWVFDIVYNPLETKLIREAKERGCPTLSGIEMFVNQGAIAFEWWTGSQPNLKTMKQVVIEHLGL